MKKILTFLLLSLSTVPFLSFSPTGSPKDNRLEAYLPKSGGEIVAHTYYTLAYSEEHEQALWVFYRLDSAMVSGPAERSDRFREDPDVKSGSATPADYKGSGYDRGHLCPAASMTVDRTAMDESFLMSNMSPQTPSFNRGGWKRLEETVRKWALAEKDLYVVTGPVLNGKLPHIGSHHVSVPERYYKVVYAPGKEKMTGILMPNAKIDRPLRSYAVPVDSIERITGIDFFSVLPDELEDRLESVSTWF